VSRELLRAVLAIPRRLERINERLQHIEASLRRLEAPTPVVPQPHFVGAFLIGMAYDGIGVEGFGETYASFSAPLLPGETTCWRVRPQRGPLRRGAWLVALNGAVFQRVIVGDMLQSLDGYDNGSVARLRDSVAIGVDLQVHISLPPLDNWGHR
jgi:hypothetical protein